MGEDRFLSSPVHHNSRVHGIVRQLNSIEICRSLLLITSTTIFMKKIILLIYGLIAYLLFLASFLYFIGFMEDTVVPKTIDSGTTGSTEKALLIDVSVLMVFALQHSIMARPGFKKWWTRIIPAAIERSTYVLLSSLALLLIAWQWVPLTAVVWKSENDTISLIVYIVAALGWLMVPLSTLMINHFELFGLKQVYDNLVRRRSAETPFTINIFYGFVRHPLMLGFLIALWATPVMTAGHLLLSAITTLYIIVAVKFLEEKDLQKLYGDQYLEYKRRVPMFIPFTKLRK
jgi:protein-S-isoprenylcysteine O-methyltransferase Ste14